MPAIEDTPTMWPCFWRMKSGRNSSKVQKLEKILTWNTFSISDALCWPNGLLQRIKSKGISFYILKLATHYCYKIVSYYDFLVCYHGIIPALLNSIPICPPTATLKKRNKFSLHKNDGSWSIFKRGDPTLVRTIFPVYSSLLSKW